VSRTFNGTNSVGIVGGNVSGPGIAWSVAVWIKAAALANTNADFYGEGLNGNSNPFLQWFMTVGNTVTAAFRADGGGSSDLLVGLATVADGTWKHMCLTQGTDNVITQYVNGVSDGTLTRTGNSTGTTTLDRVGFGFFVTTGTNLFTGSAAHGAGWSRKLAVQEVVSLANGLLPSHLGPTHYWPLWGVDSPEPDIGNGTHALSAAVSATAGATQPPTGVSLLTV
jgi:hypothetical protein